MDIFEFIDKHVTRKLLPFVRLMTIYTTDGVVSNICLVRYNDKKIAKKAAKMGLNADRVVLNDGAGTKLKNPKPYDISRGEYYLNYSFGERSLTIFKQ